MKTIKVTVSCTKENVFIFNRKLYKIISISNVNLFFDFISVQPSRIKEIFVLKVMKKKSKQKTYF